MSGACAYRKHRRRYEVPAAGIQAASDPIFEQRYPPAREVQTRTRTAGSAKSPEHAQCRKLAVCCARIAASRATEVRICGRDGAAAGYTVLL